MQLKRFDEFEHLQDGKALCGCGGLVERQVAVAAHQGLAPFGLLALEVLGSEKTAMFFGQRRQGLRSLALVKTGLALRCHGLQGSG